MAIDPRDTENLYRTLLRQYREISERFMDPNLVPGGFEYFELDREKNRIHKSVKRIGAQLLKPEAEVFSDIVGSSMNLSDSELQEFEVINHTKMEVDPFVYGEPEAGIFFEEDVEIEGERAPRVVRSLTKDQIAIIFTRENSVAILPPAPRLEGYERSSFAHIPLHLPGTKEVIRRAIRFARDNDCPIFLGSYFSHNFSSNTYGVVVDSENFYRMVSILRNHREEYGIREQDLDSEIVKKDQKNYEKEVTEGLKPLAEFMGEDAARYLFDYEWKKHFVPGTPILTNKELLSEMYNRHLITDEQRKRGFPQSERTYREDEQYSDSYDEGESDFRGEKKKRKPRDGEGGGEGRGNRRR